MLSARYHLFVRATEGAYTCLSETGPHVTLARHERCPECRAVSFEFGACKRCGSLYLSGTLSADSGTLTLGPQLPGKPRTWLLMDKGTDIIDEDDETLEEPSGKLDSRMAVLCASCGGIYEGSRATCGRAECGSARLLLVRKLNTLKDTITGCLVCGGRGAAMVRGFESGGDAAASVLPPRCTSRCLPPPIPIRPTSRAKDASSCSSATVGKPRRSSRRTWRPHMRRSGAAGSSFRAWSKKQAEE